MRAEEFKKKIKTISGRIMRSTAYNEQSAAKTVRNMVEAGVRSGLMYRDRGDDAALIMLDVDEAESLVAEWDAALEDEEGGDREIAAGQALAEFVGALVNDARLACGAEEAGE